MSIGTVVFYRMRGSLSSGEYPLLSPNQVYPSNEIRRYYNVKYRDGLQITLDVPTFTGYRDVNLCTVDDHWYWVTEYREKTAAEGQITYTLDYAAPTDLIRQWDEFTCDAKRTPYATPAQRWLMEEVSNGQMVVEDTYDFSALNINVNAPLGTGYWIQVSGHTNNGEQVIYGGFIGYDEYGERLDHNFAIPADSNKNYVPYSIWLIQMYNITHLTDADIDDVSISKRCPYKTVTTVLDPVTGKEGIKLLSRQNTPIEPEETVSGYYVYNISSLLLRVNYLVVNSATISIHKTDEVANFGTVGLYDWNRNEIMCLDGDRRLRNIEIAAHMHSDVSGIYCIVSYNNSTISIPEGKLPYYGNAVDNYKAYSMEADRMAMQFAVQTADYNRETEITSAIGNTVAGVANNAMIGGLGGNPVSMASGIVGGITSGIVSGYQSERAYQLALKTAQFNADISKKRATSQPSSGYNVAYGSIYAFLNENYPLCVMTKRPNCDATTFSTWNQQHGYPSEGVRTIRAQTGYYQGMILADGSIDANGMYFDRLNEIFQQGFKFVYP